MDTIIEYFNVIYFWKNDKPCIKFTLKEEKKKTKKPLFKKNMKQPISGAQKEYYIHYLGKDVGEMVYKERRKTLGYLNSINWALNNLNLKADDRQKLLVYRNNTLQKSIKNSQEFFKTPEGKKVRKDLRKKHMNHLPNVWKANKERWQDEEWVRWVKEHRKEIKMYERAAEKNKKRMQDPVYFKKFMEIVRNPKRINKIKKSLKKRWEWDRKNDQEKVERMIKAGRNRNYELNGYKMNSIEYLIAQLLNQLNIEFEYGKYFIFDKLIYVPDFYLNNHNLIIECYGDYWHAHPQLVEQSPHIFRIPYKDIWKKDNKKKKEFEKRGYRFISFWERDIETNLEQIKNKILCILKKK